MPLSTLKNREEFQRVRGGGRHSCAAFVLEGKARLGAEQAIGPRFGFTVTKKLGNAVVRNRIRRRLRAALVEVAPIRADQHFDYVLVARNVAFDQPFEQLKSDLEAGFQRVHTALPHKHTAVRQRAAKT